MNGYNKLRKKAWELLVFKLTEDLHYHSIRHTINALKHCEDYLRYYQINAYDSKLLRLGVLLHDIGFTVSYENHEIQGVKIAIELMSECNFSKNDIQVVTGLIMATKLPQSPKNLLEEIICDVDLDYLGRPNYYKISELLYKELLVKNEYFDRTQWNRMQIDFLLNHSYHTKFARIRRQVSKDQRIAELMHIVSIDEKKLF